MAVEEGSDRRMHVAAESQALFRAVNERLEDLNHAFELVVPSGEFVCECANHGCIENVTLTVPEYEAVRQHGARFFVAPSDEHVWPDVERVVERHESYWVVEKIDAAGRLAERVNPRTRSLPVKT
jgi:hypothetical protein